MANGIFNIARGKIAYYGGLPAASDALVFVLLKTVPDADATLADHDTLAAVLASNTEADFTNYARKSITSVTVTVDDVNDRTDVDVADQTWNSAGGTTDNTLVKLVVGYDPDTAGGTDADIIPLTHHDFAVTTDGSDVVAQISSSGFWRSA